MKKIIIPFIILLLPLFAKAQFWEGGVYGGISYYQGDMSTYLFPVEDLQPTVGALIRYNMQDALTLRLSGGWSRAAYDMAHTNPSYEYYDEFLIHNLHFRTDIIELSAMAEWNLLGFDPYNLRKTLTPYLFAGVTGFYFNPKAQYFSEWVALQPLGTEGQGMEGFDNKYSRISFAIPAGIGVKFAVNDLWNIGLEWGARFTFTDYIDDASNAYVSRPELIAGNGELAANLANRMGEYLMTEPVVVPTGTSRGNPDSNDIYVFLSVVVSYNFMDNGLVGFRRRNSKRSNCPTNF